MRWILCFVKVNWVVRHGALELEKLRLLYGSAVSDVDDLEALRWRLTRDLRDGTQDP